MKKIFVLLLATVGLNGGPAWGYERAFLRATADQPVVLNPQDVPTRLYESSFALVISNSQYRFWDPLPFSGRELDDVTTALRNSGFDVLRLSDLDGNQMRNEINEFFQSYGRQKNTRIVFYYSGHGYLDSDTNDGYLVPIDAQRGAQSNLLVKAIPIEDVRNAAMRMPAVQGLFIFDNCYSGMVFKSDGVAPNPAIRSGSSTERWRVLRSGSERRARQFIAAGGPGEVLPARSPVAAAFIQGLAGAASISRDGYVTAAELAFYIQNNATTRMQTPRYLPLGGTTGDMVFRAGSPPTSAETRAEPVVPPSVNVATAPVTTGPRPAPVVREKVTFAGDAFFGPKSAGLSSSDLAKLTDLATKAKGVSLEVIIAVGHADSVEASDAAAQKLSVQRAEAVKGFLVSEGIERNRVYTEGKGLRQPVASNATAEGRSKNRRVEVEVVGTRPRSQ